MSNTEKIDAFREMLPHILKLCGWSNADLGRMLGLSRQCVSGIIKGRQKMTMAQYIAIRHLIESWIWNQWVWNHADVESTRICTYISERLDAMDGGKNWTHCIFEKGGIIF